ncbi:BQ5605_C032g11066 [Microbotryum silenes-dioicae]|uniref:BQ5605_C032g11066 protein n=1 Tax=Microbotryum silenes-dioicae TaxID=796604 RepID=A0A2X0NA94_9BASI|nr:BQ5605_C032g11066 [Microbotryum silenes-dioicae]
MSNANNPHPEALPSSAEATISPSNRPHPNLIYIMNQPPFVPHPIAQYPVPNPHIPSQLDLMGPDSQLANHHATALALATVPPSASSTASPLLPRPAVPTQSQHAAAPVTTEYASTSPSSQAFPRPLPIPVLQSSEHSSQAAPHLQSRPQLAESTPWRNSVVLADNPNPRPNHAPQNPQPFFDDILDRVTRPILGRTSGSTSANRRPRVAASSRLSNRINPIAPVDTMRRLHDDFTAQCRGRPSQEQANLLLTDARFKGLLFHGRVSQLSDPQAKPSGRSGCDVTPLFLANSDEDNDGNRASPVLFPRSGFDTIVNMECASKAPVRIPKHWTTDREAMTAVAVIIESLPALAFHLDRAAFNLERDCTHLQDYFIVARTSSERIEGKSCFVSRDNANLKPLSLFPHKSSAEASELATILSHRPITFGEPNSKRRVLALYPTALQHTFGIGFPFSALNMMPGDCYAPDGGNGDNGNNGINGDNGNNGDNDDDNPMCASLLRPPSTNTSNDRDREPTALSSDRDLAQGVTNHSRAGNSADPIAQASTDFDLEADMDDLLPPFGSTGRGEIQEDHTQSRTRRRARSHDSPSIRSSHSREMEDTDSSEDDQYSYPRRQRPRHRIPSLMRSTSPSGDRQAGGRVIAASESVTTITHLGNASSLPAMPPLRDGGYSDRDWVALSDCLRANVKRTRRESEPHISTLSHCFHYTSPTQELNSQHLFNEFRKWLSKISTVDIVSKQSGFTVAWDLPGIQIDEDLSMTCGFAPLLHLINGTLTAIFTSSDNVFNPSLVGSTARKDGKEGSTLLYVFNDDLPAEIWNQECVGERMQEVLRLLALALVHLETWPDHIHPHMIFAKSSEDSFKIDDLVEWVCPNLLARVCRILRTSPTLVKDMDEYTRIQVLGLYGRAKFTNMGESEVSEKDWTLLEESRANRSLLGDLYRNRVLGKTAKTLAQRTDIYFRLSRCTRTVTDILLGLHSMAESQDLTHYAMLCNMRAWPPSADRSFKFTKEIYQVEWCGASQADIAGPSSRPYNALPARIRGMGEAVLLKALESMSSEEAVGFCKIAHPTHGFPVADQNDNVKVSVQWLSS